MVTDLSSIKLMDVRVVVERDLGPSRRGGGSYRSYACPLHHEQKGSSLVVWADGWHCFGKCQTGGDAIAWMQAYHHMDFKQAVEALGGDSYPVAQRAPVSVNRVRAGERAPDAAWQRGAWDVIERAQSALWSDAGERARRYLAERRGLSEATIREAMIGYVPGGPGEWVRWGDHSVPCGILLPWVIDGEVWALKVRRAAGAIKYEQVAGGSSGGLYGIDRVEDWQVVVVVEGEFDALIISQATRVLAGVALGSASNTLRPRWLDRLMFVAGIRCMMDDDAAGMAREAQLLAMSARIAPVHVPDPHHDVSDYWLADRDGCRRWLLTV